MPDDAPDAEVVVVVGVPDVFGLVLDELEGAELDGAEGAELLDAGADVPEL